MRKPVIQVGRLAASCSEYWQSRGLAGHQAAQFRERVRQKKDWGSQSPFLSTTRYALTSDFITSCNIPPLPEDHYDDWVERLVKAYPPIMWLPYRRKQSEPDRRARRINANI